MTPELFLVDRGERPGRLSLMLRPGGGDSLAAELDALADAGVEVLVSLLTPAEEAELGLADEGALAEASGLRFVPVAVPDLGIPEDVVARTVAAELASELARGRHLALHCRATLGRAPTLAACVLAQEGMPVAQAWAALSRARGLGVPETEEQRALVARLYG